MNVEDDPTAITADGLTVVRIDAALYFANSEAPQDRLRDIVISAEPEVRTVVIDFEGVNFTDSQGADAVMKLVETGEGVGVEVRLARVKHRVYEVLERDGVVERIGEDHFYPTVYDAASDYLPIGEHE